ncbi:TolC family protein [Verrucomicrobiales bacterium]|nr:TolC family protein [Verrucomicrobiales bacterium]
MYRFASIAPAIFIALCFLPGCGSLSPQADRPAGELPGSYAADAMPKMELENSLQALFSDRQLHATVARAVARNPDLQVAWARLDEAGFNLRKTQGTLLPTLTGTASARRDKISGGRRSSDLAVGLDASWEVDIWGRLRSGVSASEADRASFAADYAAARQSLIAQTMQAWFELVRSELSLQLSLRQVDSLESTQKVIDRRFEGGQATLAETDLSLTDLENARADLAASRDDRDQAARQLRVLTGDYPDAKISASSWPSLKRGVRAGVPSDLLRQRPDVASAYQEILAADARVKVAHADLFPSFVLTASSGQVSSMLSNLASSGFNAWSLVASLSAPIFEGGQRRAELGAAGKRAEQAFHSYQSVVLNAFNEVEDALGSEHYLAAEEKSRLAALDAARGAYSRSKRDYEAGITDLFSLLDSQRSVFATEQQTIDLRSARLSNRVALALALGKAE